MSIGLERLGAVLDSLRVGVVAIDAKGCVQLQNQEASRILGVSRRSSYGRPLAEALDLRHPAVSILMESLSTGRDLSANEREIRPRHGERALRVDLAASPIVVDGEPDGAGLTLHDRTIGRELEDMVDQHARSEIYARLASGIAHEIRNPLGGIRGSAELLAGKLEGQALQRFPNLIVEQTDRILRLLDEFAELTQGGELRSCAVNIHEMLDNMLTLESQSNSWSGIEVRREYDPSIPELELDPDRITQVFMNLTRNAVQAMEGRGQLTVRTRIDRAFHMSPEASKPTRMLRIDVDDTGPGILDEDLPLVFTPFFTRREGGTGLGLALTQHWVVKHGGRIQMLPGHAGGTCARVLLPVKEPS